MNTATLQVSLIGYTVYNDLGALEAQPGYLAHPGTEHAEDLIEFAGRSCYQSWSRPNPDTATMSGYMSNIIDSGHFSVLEHASVSLYIQGVSRSLTHELVRHRHLSPSQLSQRFVNGEDAAVVLPPAVLNSPHAAFLIAQIESAKNAAQDAYRNIVHVLEREGLGRKQAREAARAVLPNATETRLVMSGNHRAWRDFLGKRYSVHADAEIQALAVEILRHLREVAPTVYADIPTEPFA